MLNCLAQVFLPTPPYDYLRLYPLSPSSCSSSFPDASLPHSHHHRRHHHPLHLLTIIILITVIITTVINIIIVIVTRGLALYLRARPLGFTTSPWLLPDRPSATISQAIRARDSCEPAKQSCRRTTASPLHPGCRVVISGQLLLFPFLLPRLCNKVVYFCPLSSSDHRPRVSPSLWVRLPLLELFPGLSLSTCSAACTACTVRDRWSLNLS